jgi:NAD(P)H-flavin reductase
MAEHNVPQSSFPVLAPGAANPYLPQIAAVREVIRETPNILTFRIVLDDDEAMRAFRFEPGQVGQLSLFGVGEATFVINSPPTRREYLQFSVMRAGEVTTALHGLKVGDKVGVRAPLGNFFPYRDMQGKDVLLVGGGIGMAPLRTLLLFMLDNREEYGKITLLYGARSPQDMAYSYEVSDWLSRSDMETVLTIDREAEGWAHKVGLIPNVLLEMAPTPDNTVAVTCGPPVMIKFTLQALDKLRFPPERIITTLERRMKCGIGICGRCNIGEKYVCMDGPVFSCAELRTLPNEL